MLLNKVDSKLNKINTLHFIISWNRARKNIPYNPIKYEFHKYVARIGKIYTGGGGSTKILSKILNAIN